MTSMTVATSLLENDWLDNDRSMSDYYRMGARPRVRPDTSAPDQSETTALDSGPPPANDDKLSGYSKIAPSISSYRQLPEEYLQCTAVDQGYNFSGGSFYNDMSSSDNNVIDISKYLLDSGQDQAKPEAKLTVDLPAASQYSPNSASYSAHPGDSQSHLDTNHDADESKGLHVDLPESLINETGSQQASAAQGSSAVAADNFTGYSTLGNIPAVLAGQSTAAGGYPEDPSASYIQANFEEEDDVASDTSSLISRPISISSSVEISGGTSGDSGFNDGRNTSNTNNLKKCSDYKKPDSHNGPSRDHSGNQAPPI